MGKSAKGRSSLIKQGGSLALVKEDWKYISPSNGVAYSKLVGIATGNLPKPQLFNLKDDISEKNNLADKYPEKVKELSLLMEAIKNKKD